MKKLLLVLLVAALASFLLVGCFGTTPPPDDDDDDDDGVVGICPTVAITSQFAAVGGKTYIKGGEQTITVTFAVPTEPVSVYVGYGLRLTLEELLQTEVVMHPNDTKTVYTGKFEFGEEIGGCSEAYIYVETCDTCAACKYPYTVDTVKPFIGQVEICIDACSCDGCELSFTGKKTADCDSCDPTVYCGDCCSGFASWSVDIYNKYPFDDCCDVPCVEPIDSGTGECQVDFTTTCLEESSAGSGTRTVYALITLLDNVGNKTKMGTTITLNPDTCDTISLSQWPDGDCVDSPDFVVCD